MKSYQSVLLRKGMSEDSVLYRLCNEMFHGFAIASVYGAEQDLPESLKNTIIEEMGSDDAVHILVNKLDAFSELLELNAETIVIYFPEDRASIMRFQQLPLSGDKPQKKVIQSGICNYALTIVCEDGRVYLDFNPKVYTIKDFQAFTNLNHAE